MDKQFWLADCYVDLSRNQLQWQQHSLTLAPKAMRVLHYLAKQQGQVVSYDELFDAVWSDTVVTPNTLQRNIALLRKAFAQHPLLKDAIHTHAKQGYSLECAVSLEPPAKTDSDPLKESGSRVPVVHQFTEKVFTESDGASVNNTAVNNVKVNNSRANTGSAGATSTTSDESVNSVNASVNSVVRVKRTKPIIITGLILSAMICVVAFGLIRGTGAPAQTPQLILESSRNVTATDAKEFGASYSHDGDYIIFHRYLEQACINHLWARHGETLSEVKLTAEQGTYSDHSLSPDGKTMVFVKQQDCNKPVTADNCYTLMSVDFTAALRRPQTPSEVLDCQTSMIKRPTLLDNQRLVVMVKRGGAWRLVIHSLTTQQSQTFYQPSNQRLISYTIIPSRELFAIVTEDSERQPHLHLIDFNGVRQSSQPIQLPNSLPAHLVIDPIAIPNSEYLLFSFAGVFYTLGFDGRVNRTSWQPDSYMVESSFHPDGERLLLIEGQYDSDLIRLEITGDEAPNWESHSQVVGRSTVREDFGVVAPNGKDVAFVSSRTGRNQIWLQRRGEAKLLSQFTEGQFIYGLRWAEDGQQLLVLRHYQLYRLALNGNTKLTEIDEPVDALFHWNNQQQTALVNMRRDGELKLVLLDLLTGTQQVLSEQAAEWAVTLDDGRVIYMDKQFQFYRHDVIHARALPALAGQGSKTRFVAEGQNLYGVNTQQQLWRFHLPSQQLTMLSEVPTDIQYLTDGTDNQLLFKRVVVSRKQIIEHSFSR